MATQIIRKVVAAGLLIAGVLLTSVVAQTSAPEQAAKLRAQLADVQAQQDENQTRLQELAEALKPENIEHGLAGVGSTHPEELREQRRQQLEKKRTAVQAQLDQLGISRSRLEAALAAADARAYQESARGPSGSVHGPQATTVESPTGTLSAQTEKPIKKSKRKHARRPRTVAPISH